MFKKPYQTKPQSTLRVSACRHLAQETREAYPKAWEAVDAADDSAEAATPAPGRLQAAKFVSHVGTKGELIYSESGDPLWVRAPAPGRDGVTLFPTVYTLWRFPEMLPVLWTIPAVTEKLAGGADLMVPGILVPEGGLGEMKKGMLVAVCCPGNLAAQAVGVLAIDAREMASKGKGKAVLIVHTYKDHLWESGSKASIPTIPPGPADKSSESDAAPTAEPSEDRPASTDKDVAEAAAVSPAEMDSLLMTTLKQVMATVLDEGHAADLLPLNSSALYAGYMIPNAPPATDIDIKKSTYKKLAKFLKAAEKQGLVKLKDIRGETHVKSLSWKHPDMVQYQPYRVRSGARAKTSEETAGGPKQAAQDGNGARPAVGISELIKPPKELAPLFDDVGKASPSGFYTRQQARNVLEEYIQGRGLVDPSNPRQIKLDHRLCDGLMTKEEYSKLATFPRDKLQARLQERMTLYTKLSLPGKTPTIRMGKAPVVDIACERKMGNKVVTRTVGLEAYGIDPAAVAKELRKICASSTTVDPIPGKKGMQAVVVQGHQISAVSKLLEKHGLPSDVLKSTDKSGKAKKRAAGK
ncbi:hypothetical protein GGF46_005353 [Coemansia sp. RSA 552]|nr:hypothetical protein GGF46_005353 [Coemansia sp. RSA 552]